MAETYKILDLDLNFDKLITSTAEAKAALANYKTELNALKVANKGNSEEAVILEARIKAVSNEVRVNTKLVSDATQAGNGQNLTIEQLRKALSVVSVQWARLTQDERENTEEGKKLTAQKTELTASLKKEEAATGDARRNVGNYAESIVDAAKKMGLFGGTFGGIITNISAFKDSLILTKQSLFAIPEGAGAFATAMNVIKAAIISTGIGALIVLLGIVIEYLSKFYPIVARVEQTFNALKAAVEVVAQRIVGFFQAIKNVGDLLKGFDQILRIPIEGFGDLGASMKQAALDAIELTKAQQDLEDALQVSDIMTAKANQRVKELIVQSKNRSLSESERIAKLKEATALEESDFARRSKIAAEEIRLSENVILTKAGITENDKKRLKKEGVAYAIKLKDRINVTDAEVEALKAAELKKISILDESTQRQEKIQNQSDALADKAAAKQAAAATAYAEAQKSKQDARKKAQEDTIKALQEEADLIDALSGKKIKSENQLVEAYNARLAVVEAQRTAGLISETKYQTDLANLQTEFEDASEQRLKQLADARIKDAEEELEILRLTHERKIEDGKPLTGELVAQEIERLTLIKDAAEDIARQRFEAGEITSEEFRAIQLEGEAKFLKDQKALYGEVNEQRKGAQAIDFANDLELRRLHGENTLQIQIDVLKEQERQEIEIAERTGASVQKIREKYALAEQKIRKLATENQLKQLGDSLGQIAELLGKQTAAGKVAGIAQATINTYLGVSQVLAAPPSGPEPFNTILKGISIGTTIATGIANVAKIAAVKAERGGKFVTAGGNLHSAGGTIYRGEDGNAIEVERDENLYVLNRRASAHINRLSALNEHYGGVSFSSPVTSRFHADGGLVARSMESESNAVMVAQILAESINNIRPVVSVVDIIDSQQQYVRLVDGATIG